VPARRCEEGLPEAFVGNGVNVGDLAVVGARAVVVKDVRERAVVAGNPARVVGVR